jgi:transcriptional regulator
MTNSDQLHGTLDMLVLKVLAPGAEHGYGIAVRLQRLSDEVLQVEEGSLYPALYRMEQRGWIASSWAYREQPRAVLLAHANGAQKPDAETQSWRWLSGAVGRILRRRCSASCGSGSRAD